ncbi:MAG: DUF3883 domain-containing protein [Limisphaerales bacterium]
MIPTEQLRELQAEFESKRCAEKTVRKKMEKLRRKFVKLFPRSRIPHLTLDQFVQGKGSKDSFCYWVERRTSALGHIQGTPSKKFGVFFSKKRNRFVFTKKFRNEDDARVRILNEIGTLLDAAKSGDIEKVRGVAISPMFKGKILFLYFPERFINIFSERHVDHYLSQLRLNEPDADNDLISKRERLTKFKNADAVMKNWSTFEFSDFLGWAWPPPPRDKKKIPTQLKDYVLIFPAPEETNPEFIELQFGETPEPLTAGATGNGGRTDFDQRNRRNKIVGNQGEDVVFLAEQQKLKRNGKADLAAKVKAVCKEDDSAGYDILSFELDGQEKQIEVKSTTLEAPSPGSCFHFHLTAKEYEEAGKLPNFYLYVVFEVKSKKPKICAVRNPACLVPRRLRLKPSAYYATLTIA